MRELPPDCVQRVRAGDVHTFEQLFRVTHAPLLAFATRYLDDSARAEELLQDLFFDLWRTRADWHVTGSVTAYLYSAVRNRALNIRRRDLVEQRWADEEARDDTRAVQQDAELADAVVDLAVRTSQLEDAMRRLPARCALIMQMRWHGGLSYAEIADTLGISVKGVENQLSRGLKALRRALMVD